MYTIKNSITIEDYNFLRENAGWFVLSIRQAKNAIKNSYYIVGVYDGEKIVGCARVVGDGGYVAYIADVVVRKEYQRKGIGRMMMENVLTYLRNSILESEKLMIILVAAKGKEEFYEKFNFTRRPNEELGAGMTMWIEK